MNRDILFKGSKARSGKGAKGRQSVSKCNALLEGKEVGRQGEPDHERSWSQQIAKNIREPLVLRVTKIVF